MSAIRRSASVAVLLFVTATADARAQDPVRLPGVNVTARIDRPGPRILVGIVVDTAGNPVGGAEVTIPDLRRRLYSRGDGTFRFDSIPRGEYEMRARKIGFAPQVRHFDVDTAGGVAQFALMPLVQALPVMVSTAGRRGLSGNVADMQHASLPGATVRILGAGMSTTTDADGHFFIPADAGRYMVSVEKDSFSTKLFAVTIPKDSGRHVNAWLMPSLGPVSKEKFWNIPDLRERQAWVKPQNRVFFTREDLVRLKVEWISDVVVGSGPKLGFREPISPDCRAVIDGGPEIADVSRLTIDDVESVEIYRGFPTSISAASAGGRRGRGNFLPMTSNSRFAAHENSTRICPGVYVWLR
jgi:hypothetical protein